jgi:hypothetical protein
LGITQLQVDKVTLTRAAAGDPLVGPLEKLVMDPRRVHARSTVHSLRDFLIMIRVNVTDKNEQAEMDRTISDLLPFVDGIMSTTHYTSEFSFPTRAECESIKLYRELKKHDAPRLEEDLRTDKEKGTKVTFETAISKLASFNSKNKKVFCVVRMVDEAVGDESLLSQPVLDALRYDNFTRLNFVSDELTGVVTTTMLANGEIHSVTPTDAAYLLALGKDYEGDYDDFIVYADLTGDWAADITDLVGDSADILGELHQNSVKTPWKTVGQIGFIDINGYPKIDFVDMESRIRGILAFKGFSDDMGSIVGPHFFTSFASTSMD